MAKKLLSVNILEKVDTDYGEITVARVTKTGAILYRQGNCHQSESDGKGISLSTYIHALYGFLAQAKARNVLMIGVGGGTLANMLSSEGARVTLVDINPVAFEVARHYFGLPDSLPRHAEDGLAFLKRGAVKFDAIVLDAYHASEIPDHLTTPAFFAEVRRRLTRNGLCLANVYVKNDTDDAACKLAATMADEWPALRVLDTPGALERNTILVAGAKDVTEPLQPPWLMLKPRTGADDLRMELKQMRFVG
jgi:spermidine synthase